jgi:hypothetical protein
MTLHRYVPIRYNCPLYDSITKVSAWVSECVSAWGREWGKECISYPLCQKNNNKNSTRMEPISQNLLIRARQGNSVHKNEIRYNAIQIDTMWSDTTRYYWTKEVKMKKKISQTGTTQHYTHLICSTVRSAAHLNRGILGSFLKWTLRPTLTLYVPIKRPLLVHDSNFFSWKGKSNRILPNSIQYLDRLRRMTSQRFRPPFLPGDRVQKEPDATVDQIKRGSTAECV